MDTRWRDYQSAIAASIISGRRLPNLNVDLSLCIPINGEVMKVTAKETHFKCIRINSSFLSFIFKKKDFRILSIR